MQQVYSQVRAAIQGMWRYRWYALLAAWLIAVAGWFFIYTLPDVYETHTNIYVDTQSVLRPLLKDLAVQSDVVSEVNLMTKALLSQPNLEQVIRDTDLDLKAKTAEDMQALVDQLRASIQITGGGKSNQYEIRYQDSNPQTALRVVKTLLNTLVEDTLGVSRTDTTNAQGFLDKQIRDYEVRLTAAEQRLADFKKQHIGVMPSDGRDYYLRLQQAIDARKQTEMALALAIQRRNELQRQLQGEEPVFGVVGSASGSSGAASARINELEAQLEELRLRFTDKHPDVITIKETIAQLQARAEEEQAEQMAGAGPSETVETADVNSDAPASPGTTPAPTTVGATAQPMEINPVYQSIKIAYSETEVEVASLGAQAAQQQSEINRLKTSITTIPQVEADLVQLNRDYEVTKAQYEALLQRMETARLSDEADQSTDDIKFRIIEPPTAMLEPIGPNRPLLMSLTLGTSLLAGLALAFLLNQINPVFVSSRALRKATGLPIFGTVSIKRLPAQQAKVWINNISLASAAGLLVAIYILAMAIEGPASRALRSLLNWV